MHGLCITEAIQGRPRVSTAAGYHHTLRCGWDSSVVQQQFHTDTKAKG